VEELFLAIKIQVRNSTPVKRPSATCRVALQVLVCTATLAWGVNFPCRLVVVKGTEIFDAALGRYKDMPVTDVLQMVRETALALSNISQAMMTFFCRWDELAVQAMTRTVSQSYCVLQTRKLSPKVLV